MSAHEPATADVERMSCELQHAARWFEDRAKDYRENAKRYAESDVSRAQGFIRWSNDCANQAASCREALSPSSEPAIAEGEYSYPDGIPGTPEYEPSRWVAQSSTPPASKGVEAGHADTEGEAMASFAHLNCPLCAGSGHVEDAEALRGMIVALLIALDDIELPDGSGDMGMPASVEDAAGDLANAIQWDGEPLPTPSNDTLQGRGEVGSDGCFWRSGHDGEGPDPSRFFCEVLGYVPAANGGYPVEFRLREVRDTEAEARTAAFAGAAAALQKDTRHVG